MFVRLPALAALALTGSVTAFAPLAPPRFKATSHLAAVAEPSKKPQVFFQNRIAEPADVGSVPSAAALLSTKLPEEPFVINYRSTTVYDDVEKRPILDLSVLKNLKVDGDSVAVDSGVTVGQLAAVLKKSASSELKELFTALPAIPNLSIIEAAIDGRFSKLNKAIEEVHVVDDDGNISSKQLSDVDVEQDIVVNAVLSPQPRDSSGLVARWYSRKAVDTPIPDGFVTSLPEDVKVIAHKYGMFNKIPNIVVFVDGGRDLELSKEDWKEVLVETPQELWYLQKDLADAGGFDTLTATGVLDMGALSEITPSFTDILEVFQERDQNLVVWLEHDKLRASFPAEHPPDIDEDTAALFKFDDKVSKTISPSIAKALFSGRKGGTQPQIIEGTRIPGFKGEIYDGVRGQMQNKRFQYATSSYDNMMNPSVIVYPLDAEDVSAAIKYATLDEFEEVRKTIANPSGRKYKVMARGGGHQYCGVSCDNGSLIISLEYLNNLEHKVVNLKNVTGPNGEPHDVEIELQIGTGNKLKQFATWNNRGGSTDEDKASTGKNNNFGWTIPHGECPTVGIGGHSQSGGYGHIARAFGLAIDYVYGFTIVLADGTIHNVSRDSTDQADKDLYWAVLGGSPGAFGVNTNLIIHPILDKDYPHSAGYARTIIHKPEKMLATLEILEDFINKSKEGDEGAMCEELDLMVSLTSNSGNRVFDGLNQEKDNIIPNLNVILFELECRDRSNKKAAEQMDAIIKEFEKRVQWRPSLYELYKGGKWNPKKHKKLSEMSLLFVRSPPAVTAGGRENRKPYRKTSYGSKEKVTEGWSKAYGDLLNDVVDTEHDISCVFQVVVGGGKQTSNGQANLNAIAHRDAQLHGLVFDLFRGEDEDTIRAADAFSKRFEIDVVNRHQTAHPKVMAQWASHGDLDMNKQEVWEKYYDDPAVYHKLRRIKKEVDPDDVFHSRFTVRPAED